MSRPQNSPVRNLLGRLVGRLARRVDARADGEGGYLLVETLVVISLITIIMGAVGAQYVNGLSVTHHSRLQTTAVQVADSTMEVLRAYQPSDLLSGRGQGAVSDEYDYLSSVQNVGSQLSSNTGQRAYDATASTQSGTAAGSATIPTSSNNISIGAASTAGATPVTYLVWQYLECTAPTSNGSCASTLALNGNNVINNIRAVVVVTWSQDQCPLDKNGVHTCAYTSTTIINGDQNLVFDLNQPLPPAPVVDTSKSPFTIAVNDQLGYKFATTANNPGVSPITWNAANLPSGIGIAPDTGIVSGTVGGSSGTVGSAVVATDAYQRQSCDTNQSDWATKCKNVTWTVEPALAVTNPGPQATDTDKTVNLQLQANGGSGVSSNYTFGATGLPDGLSISSSGLITGKPTAPGPNNGPVTYNVTVTVTDSQPCPACAKQRTAQVAFTWTVSYPDLKFTSTPAAQVWTVATALADANSNPTGTHGQVQMNASGGDGNYTWSATGLPAGVTINSATGLISGTPPTTTSSGTATITVTDPSASNNTTDADQARKRSASTTFTWSVVAKPSFDTPAAQKNSIGAAVNLQLAHVACPNSPCTFRLDGAPGGLAADSSGLITGTVTGTSGTKTVTITATDAAGATGPPTTFSWVVVDAPGISGWTDKSMTVTELYNQKVDWTCPYATCTIRLGSGMVPGLGLETVASKSGDNSADTTVTVSGSSGSVYLTGTIAAGAVSSGTSATYRPGITITSGDGSRVSPAPVTFTVFTAPTLAQIVNKNVTQGGNVNVAVNYTCPSAATATPCRITLAGSVPGVGLSTSPGATGDQGSSTSVTITNGTTGTVYLVGTVQSNAITGSDTSKAYNPVLKIDNTSWDNFTSAPDTATWTAYLPPTITTPGAQRHTIGQAVNFSLTKNCYNAPCSYAGVNLPSGLTIDATGLVSGTIASDATSSSAVKITITDNAGVQAATSNFAWTVDAAPRATGLADRNVTVGATYTGTAATSISYSCPRANCTINLGNPVPGLGLGAGNTFSGANTVTSLSVSLASGTVYIGGQVQSGAVTSGTKTAYNPSISITDGGGFTPTATSATWTAYSSPTVANPGTRKVSVGATDSVAVNFTCPTAGVTSCVINLAGAVPGIGLNTVPNQAGDNSAATSITTSAASGTVYLTGTVKSSAVNADKSSKTWAPALTITDGGQYSGTQTGAWTAYDTPTVTPGASARAVTEGQTDSLTIGYTCPSGSCTISLSNPVPGLGLGTSASTTTNNATSVAVTAASGSVYITGLVGDAAVPDGSTSSAYASGVVISDGVSYSSTSSPVNYTAYTRPTIASPATRRVNVGANDSSGYAYSCPRVTCTITLDNPVPGLGLSTSAGTTGNNTTVSNSVTTSGTGTIYIAGTVQNSTGDRTYNVTLSITDPSGAATGATGAATWTVSATATATVSSTNRKVTVGNVDSQQVTYTCPTASCTITLANPVPGLGLATSVQTTAVSATSLAVNGSQTVYITGKVASTAVSGSATSQNYAPDVRITDGTNTSAASTASYTIYAPPTVSGFGPGTFSRNSTTLQQLSYTCPTQNCTLSISGANWVAVGINYYGTYGDFRSSFPLTSASGNIAARAMPGNGDSTATITLTLTDGLGYSATLNPASAVWTVR